MSEGQLPKNIRIEIEDKTPNDDDHSVVVFQETEVPQRPPKPPLPIYTAWKVFSELNSESKPAVFKFPLLTDLEAEILLPDSTAVRASRQDIQRGSKWLLVEAEKKAEEEGEGENENSTSSFVFREAAVPSKASKHSDRTSKHTVTVESHIGDGEPAKGPSVQRISITKTGLPIQTVKGNYIQSGVPLTFTLRPVLQFGLISEIETGGTFFKSTPLLARCVVSLDDFPFGVRLEINRALQSGGYYFTAHSQLAESVTNGESVSKTNTEEENVTSHTETDH